MHNASIVEHHIDATPGIELVNDALNVCLLGNIDLSGLDLAGCVWRFLLRDGQSLLQGWLRDVGHEHIGTFTKEKDRGFEANATARAVNIYPWMDSIIDLPPGTGDYGILAGETTTLLSPVVVHQSRCSPRDNFSAAPRTCC